jgi:hypothetical protein
MKLDVNVLRYLSKEEFRVLTAVEMGQKNVSAATRRAISAFSICEFYFNVFAPVHGLEGCGREAAARRRQTPRCAAPPWVRAVQRARAEAHSNTRLPSPPPSPRTARAGACAADRQHLGP